MNNEHLVTPDGTAVAIDAESSMKAALTGEVEEGKKDMTPTEVRAKLESATLEGCNSYDGCASYYGKMALRYLDEYGVPEGRDLLYDKIKAEAESEEYEKCLQELTGFMVGWGENAARFAISAPPVPNPAIMHI